MEMATLHIIKGHWITSICLQSEVCVCILSVLKSEKVQLWDVALIALNNYFRRCKYKEVMQNKDKHSSMV